MASTEGIIVNVRADAALTKKLEQISAQLAKLTERPNVSETAPLPIGAAVVGAGLMLAGSRRAVTRRQLFTFGWLR